MKVDIQAVDIPKNTSDPDPEVIYTPESLREVVIAVAHLLDHYADQAHPGLQEPQNQRRRVNGTAVMVYPRAGGHVNRVGYQLFVANPQQNIIKDGKSNVVGIIFDMRAYEQIGDTYLFNMLSELANSIKKESRPSPERLKELSTQFLLAN